MRVPQRKTETRLSDGNKIGVALVVGAALIATGLHSSKVRKRSYKTVLVVSVYCTTMLHHTMASSLHSFSPWFSCRLHHPMLPVEVVVSKELAPEIFRLEETRPQVLKVSPHLWVTSTCPSREERDPHKEMVKPWAYQAPS